jgi:hypothetical protein
MDPLGLVRAAAQLGFFFRVGDEALQSGSHPGLHVSPQGPCNEAVSGEAVCSSSALFNAAS